MNVLIPTFRGQNFEFWKFKLVAFFESKGLENTLQQPVKRDKLWLRDDAKARMYILESVDDERLEIIMNESSAADMVDKLQRLYSDDMTDSEKDLRKGFLALKMAYADGTTDSKTDLRNDFLALKMAVDDNPSEFFKAFETYVDMLDSSGDRLSPKEILSCLQMSVCQSYRHLFEEVNPRLEPLEAIEEVKKNMLAVYRARTYSPEPAIDSTVESPPPKADTWNAFKEAFKDESGECHRCGQSGHWARQCPQPRECYRCGQEGHLKFQCKQQQDACYGCGQVGHRKFECPERSQPLQHHPAVPVKHHPAVPVKYQSASMAAQSVRPVSGPQSDERKRAKSPIQYPPPLMAASVSPPACEKGNESAPDAFWILDSCATYHTICDESLFTNCVSLKKPRSVEVANGHTMHTSKMGEVKVCFRVGDRSTVKVLQDVFLIEEFEQNLLSIQRLVKFGGSVVLKSSEVELRDASNQVVACGKKINNLYIVECYLEKSATINDFDIDA